GPLHRHSPHRLPRADAGGHHPVRALHRGRVEEGHPVIRLTGTRMGARMGIRVGIRMGARMGRGDAGSSLLLALAFLSLFGVVVATLLSFADTSMLATVAVRNERSNVSATEGAMHLAINTVRKSLALGVHPATTGGVNTCAVPAIGLNSVTPTATCAGQAGSGVASATVGNAPQNAILALGTSSSDGVYFLKNDASPTTVGGCVLSSSQVFALNTELDVTGSVTAQSCSGPS